MRQISHWLIVLSCALTASAVAQDTTDAIDDTNAKQTISDATTQPVESTEQNSTSKAPTKNANRAATAPGSYNPSEEISDDLSVSFPVDI